MAEDKLPKEKYKTGEKHLDKNLEDIRDLAQKGSDGNFVVMDKEISYNDLQDLKIGVRYIDKNSSEQYRTVYRVGDKLVFQLLNDL